MSTIRMRAAVLLASSFTVCTAIWVSRAPAAELNLVPWPASVKMSPGQTSLNSGSRIVCAEPSAREIAELLAGELKVLHGAALSVVLADSAGTGDIRLVKSASLTGEKYRLVADGKITIEAGDTGGFHAGTATLLQAVQAKDGSRSVPNMTIEDAPFREFRALMIDVKNFHHAPETIYKLLRLCRFYKVRYLSLHTGEPQWIGAVMESSNDVGDTFSPNQMADFIACGRRLGVYFMPHNESTPHFPTLKRALTENLNPASPYANFVDEFDGKGPYAFDGKPDERFWGFMREATRRAVDQFAAGYPSGKLPYYHIGPVLGEGGMNTQTAARFLKILMEKDPGIRMVCWDGPNASDPFLAPCRKNLVIAYYSGAFSSSKIHDYLREGWDVVNSPFYPLYILGGSDKPAPEDIFRDWNVLSAGKTERGDGLVKFDLQPEWRRQVLGAMMCSWEIGEQDQIRQARRRLPIFAEHAWNHRSQPYPQEAYKEFLRRSEAADALVDRVFAGTEDRTPPTTAAVPWKHPPAALGNMVMMQARPMVDASGVEYRFECVEGDGPSSDWQASSCFVAEDLNPRSSYAWRVKVRDRSPARNESPWSAPAAVTTAAAFPTTLKAHFRFAEEVLHGKPARDSTGNLKQAGYSNQVRAHEFPWSVYFGGQGVQVEGGWTCVGLGGAEVIGPLLDNFSVALWVLPNKEPDRQLFVSAQKDGKRGFSLLTKGNELVLDTGTVDNYQYKVPIEDRIVPRKWSHVAVTFAKLAEGKYEARFYIDGRQAGQTQTGPAAAGAGPGWSLNETSIVGVVADARVYKGSLTAAQARFLARPHTIWPARETSR